MLAATKYPENKPVSAIAGAGAGKAVPQNLVIQRKLTVGKEDDEFEKEADNTADRVMRMPEQGFIQRKCAHCEDEEKINRKPLSSSITPFIQNKSESGAAVSQNVSGSIESSRGGGSSLDGKTQSFMASRMGNDFGQVKIHADSGATQLSRSLNAKAFTVGNDIYFNEGQYRPQATEGKRLLAHELTHVLQQGGGQTMLQKKDDLIDVEIIEAPSTKLTTVSALVEDTSNNQEVILENFSTALENFETIVSSSSAKEAIPKGVGAIVLEEITKVIIKEVLDKSLKEFPAVKQIIELGASIITEVEKEKKSAGEAAESNAIGNFIVDERTKIRTLISAIKANKVELRQQAQAKYDNLKTEEEKKAYFDFISFQNSSIRTNAALFSPQALFTKITELWIKSSGTAAKPSRLFIRLDKNWNVITAHIHAPRGQRLAERLLRNAPGGKIDLNNFESVRDIEFFPEDLTFVNLTIDANGKQIGNLTSNIFGRKYVQTFVDNFTKKGLPKTSVMTGT